MIIIFKPDEVDNGCMYAVLILFAIYVSIIVIIYCEVIRKIWNYTHRERIMILRTESVSNISKNMVNWLA